MSVALSIAFTGLCALIGGDGKHGQVLLLDARGLGPVGGVTLPDHAPTLVLSLNDLANPDSSRPTRVVAGRPDASGRVDQLGLWDLTGAEVRIRAQGGAGAGVEFYKPRKGETSWPQAPANAHDPAAWRDLRFVPHMHVLAGDGRIDPALTDAAGTLPRAVAARIRLDAGLVEAAMPSQETYRDDLFEFVAEGSPRAPRQAVTDTVQWTLRTDASAVVVEIAPVGGAPVKRLLLAPSATPHRLFISNLPAENPSHADAHHGMSDEQASAVHFGAYYNLLLNAPPHRPVPVVWRTLRERRATGFHRPVLCPPALFSRQ